MHILNWFADNWVEITAAVLNLLYLWLSIKKNILLWPVGITGALLYIAVYYQTKFYADMALNGYYFVISIYGWITWAGSNANDGNGLKVSNVGKRRAIILFSIFMVLFLTSGFLLDRFTDSSIPYWDAFTTSGAVVATWMLTRKILEHWLIWIIVDLVSLGLYIVKGLYPTTVLFAVYTAMAIIGYQKWKNAMNGYGI